MTYLRVNIQLVNVNHVSPVELLHPCYEPSAMHIHRVGNILSLFCSSKQTKLGKIKLHRLILNSFVVDMFDLISEHITT